MGDISKNFSFSELSHSSTAEQRGIDNSIPSAEIKAALRSLVETVLQPLRDFIKVPILINSGYRCEALNAILGGAKTSQHRKGEAADIRSPYFTPIEIARNIFYLGLPFDQLIVYPTFVHVSHRRTGNQRGKVLYDVSYKGDKI